KRPWAKTEAELADRWRKSLKLQVLQRVALMEDILAAADKAQPVDSDGDGDTDKDDEIAAKRLGEIPKTPEERERKAREDLAKSFAGRFKRLAQVDPLEPAEMFLNSVTEAYDPHTQYLAPADKEDFDIAMSGSLEGIGALLVEDDHYIRVQELVPGGPSWRQGKLQAGDLILAVAQGKDGEPVDVADMRIKEVVKMIRGPKGTVVTLTVKKPDDTIQVISITRDVIEIEAAYARGAVLDRGDGSPPIGYIALPSFYGDTRRGGTVTGRNAPDDVRALLRELSARKVAAVVLDLRGNGGGLLDHARDITGMFIRTGPVVATRYGNGSTQVLTDDDPDIAYAGPVVVMVDRFSASASEILAGALQDYGRAVVVGTSATHGKGTVQVLIDLDRVAGRPRAPLGVVKLTIQQFFRVNGESTQLRGVVPDIALPDPAAYVKSGERFLDHAIPWSRIDALDYRRWTGARWQIDRLRAASEARQANEPVFAKVVERAAYLKQRLEQTRMPLQRDKWLARRAADKAKLDDVDLDWTKGPARFTVTVIDYAHTPGSSEAAAEWRDNAARDPWLDEAARIAADMAAAK
ncbi:MAG: tail-specific protease, partial [Deltaproteobacteria bacterium]